jgi:hypothetical protein
MPDLSQIIMILIGGGVCFALGLAVMLVIIGTIFKTRFGVNLGGANCWECGVPAPMIRHPQNLSEMLWGGWTCQCGCANDKWGNPV